MNFSVIKEIVNENDSIFTIRFDSVMVAKPGQFLMVWVPGVKEVPMSLSSIGDDFAITFKVFGESTKKLASMKKGERMFHRGPYGNPYPDPKGKTAYVAGGTGLASLLPLIRKYEGDVYTGARTRNDLFLLDDDFRIATDDGSLGFRGNVVDLFVKEEDEYDTVYVCGPEAMMRSLLDRMHRERHGNVYFSLERLMKCGIGICDSCSVNGYRVCKEGTVFTYEQLKKMDEFGVYRRSESGKIELIAKVQ